MIHLRYKAQQDILKANPEMNVFKCAPLYVASQHLSQILDWLFRKMENKHTQKNLFVSLYCM